MTSLNLDLHGPIYDVFRYPAGETQVRIKPEYVKAVQSAEEICIVARLRNAEDVIELALLNDAVEALGSIEGCGWISLVLPYLPYARADRRFTDGDCHGLKTFGQILASMAPSRVVSLDVHSDIAMNYVPNLVDVPARPLIERAILTFAEDQKTRKVCVLFPDDGARARYELSETLGSNSHCVDVKILNASKMRDPVSGKFMGFNVPDYSEFACRPTIIVDDICDGGGTFVGLGALIPPMIPLGLYVTHGIFSRGLSVLGRFSWIGSANSWDYTTPDGTRAIDAVFDAMPMLLSAAAQSHKVEYAS